LVSAGGYADGVADGECHKGTVYRLEPENDGFFFGDLVGCGHPEDNSRESADFVAFVRKEPECDGAEVIGYCLD
jgi:hypothetical protein